eukprot:scaffold274513_cov33-Tisochrysis_lutea.AAC.2
MRVLLVSDPEMEDENEGAGQGEEVAMSEAGGTLVAGTMGDAHIRPEPARRRGGRGKEETAAVATIEDEEDEDEDEDEEEYQESEEEGDEGEDEEDGEEEGGSGGATVGKKAACAICVGVGYLSDPRQTDTDGYPVDGLAHFVEHMLFMGTDAFPDENGWSKFLAERGGEDNGETDAETTTCFFDVSPNYRRHCPCPAPWWHSFACRHLREALVRFVSFFSSPLFSMDSANREVKAIESEFRQVRTTTDQLDVSVAARAWR